MNTQPNRYGLCICRTLARAANPLSLEELIILSWLESRETMGLKGFEQEYPDARKVQNTIYGWRGLRAVGYVALTDGGYVLTEAGRKVVQNGWPKNPGKGAPPPILLQGLRCRAMQLYRDGKLDAATWTDALDFWGKLTPDGFTASITAMDDDDQQVREVGRLHEALLRMFAVRLKLTA